VSRRFGAAILGCAGPRLAPEERRFFAGACPFGFILFSRNLETPEQIRALTSALRDAAGRDAPVFIDQEGGRVQRLRPPLARDWHPPLQEVARFGPRAAEAMALRARIICAELRGYGIDGNCAPALDIARPETHAVLRNRLLGTDPAEVARIGRASAEAHLSSGVLPVVKHLPGHGRAILDSHLDLPRVAAPRAALEDDFDAFRPLADLPLAMSAHVVFESIDPDRPATISPAAIALVRAEIGFRGLLMTDDISMQALSGDVAARGAAALAAGCDAVLHCNGDLAEMRALMDRVGPMSDAAQTRAEAALACRQDPGAVDIAGLEADLEALLPRNAP
jgi:beta-N-acetylhexosaminidase